MQLRTQQCRDTGIVIDQSYGQPGRRQAHQGARPFDGVTMESGRIDEVVTSSKPGPTTEFANPVREDVVG